MGNEKLPKLCQMWQERVQYLERGFVSVVEKHEDCHLECGNLQDVLPGIRACDLSPTDHIRAILLKKDANQMIKG